MKIDQLNASQLKKLQKQLEEIAVKDLDLSSEKVINLGFPVASYDYDDGEVASQFFILGRWGKTCSSTRLLDVAGNSSTADDGKVVFLLSQFTCDTNNNYSAPVDLVATPRSGKPCYTTTTLTLIGPSDPGFFNDVQITLFTWMPNGSPAPNISVDWRCRLPVIAVIQ
ncbi:MAG: hypothetical protein JO045_17950 [Mycobacterium sp.]|nr:hypothetical protein [Mycobacterium sp.]